MIGLTRQRVVSSPVSSPEEPFGTFVLNGPWQVADAGRLLVRLGVAVVLLLACWYGSANTTHVNRQLGWLAGGSLAVTVALSATVAWTTAGMARVRFLKLDMMATVRSRHPQQASSLAVVDDNVRVAAPGMRLHHRPGCQLVVGKAVVPLADLSGRSACGVCDR